MKNSSNLVLFLQTVLVSLRAKFKADFDRKLSDCVPAVSANVDLNSDENFRYIFNFNFAPTHGHMEIWNPILKAAGFINLTWSLAATSKTELVVCGTLGKKKLAEFGITPDIRTESFSPKTLSKISEGVLAEAEFLKAVKRVLAFRKEYGSHDEQLLYSPAINRAVCEMFDAVPMKTDLKLK